MLVAALGVGLVVRPQRALLAPRLAPGLTSVLTPGLGIGPPWPAPALGQATAPLLARSSQLSLSASSEPPELLELPAYPVNIYIEDTDAFAVTCARPPFEPLRDWPMPRPCQTRWTRVACTSV